MPQGSRGAGSKVIPMAESGIRERVSEAVKALEQQSSVELLVAFARESDSYRDLCLFGGIALGLVWLIFIIHSPFHFHPDLVVVLVGAFILIAAWVLERAVPLKRLLVRPDRASEAVEKSARAFFQKRGLSDTRDRSAILVYLSELERRVCFVPDIRVLGALGRAPFNTWEHRLNKNPGNLEEDLLKVLEELKEECARGMPRREDDTDEVEETVVDL